MERDFLGLNRKNYSSRKSYESASKVIRPHPLPPSQFLSCKAPTREDDIYYPLPSASTTATLSLAKNPWTSPSTNIYITPGSSTSVTNPIALNDFNSVTTFSRKDCMEDYSITRKKHLEAEQVASLSMQYSGKVHVFRNISPEKVELIMRIAGSGRSSVSDDSNSISNWIQLIRSDSNRTLDLLPQQKHSSPSPSFARGGLAMARKATLARFMEKRMHRLSNARPYSLKKFAGSNSEQASSETNVSAWQSQ